MFSLVYTVYCKKEPPELRCSVKNSVLKNFVNVIGKHVLESLNKVASLTPILKKIYQRLPLPCTHTTHCYLPVLLYIQHLLLHHHCCYSKAVEQRCSIKKGVFRNFAKLTGKHLYQSLFFNKVTGLL